DRVPVAVGAERDRATGRVLRGVLAEVAQRLLAQGAVRLGREAVGDLDVDDDAGMRVEPGRDLAQQRGELDRLEARRLLSGVCARQREHRAGEARQTAGLALDVAEEPVALGGILLRAGLE